MNIAVATTLVALSAALMAVPMASLGEDPRETRTWRFDALLDGKLIGSHEFALEQQGAETHLRTRADFRVKALFIPVYRYEHENHEVWRDGCLTFLRARTRENRAEHVVTARRSGSALEVRGPSGGAELPGCVKSFAYWDPGILQEQRLLNAQSGEYESVLVSDLGREQIKAGGRTIQAQRHALEAGDFAIHLWYSPEGEWLALETLTPQGHRLRYEIR